MDITYLDFSKTSDTVSHNNLTDKLMKYSLDEWTGTGNWLNCWAQSLVISSMKSSWRPVTTGVPKEPIQQPNTNNIFINDQGV